MTMSDCSIHAFDTPEPKTCGNCGYSEPYELDHEPIGSHVLCPGANEIFRADYTDVCEEWFREYKKPTLEQRYQKLEQVAKEEMEYIEYLESRYGALPTSKKSQLYQQLEALGVILDD